MQILFAFSIFTITAILFVLELDVISKNPYKFMSSEYKLKNQPLPLWEMPEGHIAPRPPCIHKLRLVKTMFG